MTTINQVPFVLALMAKGLRSSQARLSAMTAIRFWREGMTFENAVDAAWSLIFWR